MSNIRVHVSLFLVSLFYAVLFSWAGQIMPQHIGPEAFVFLRVITACVLFNITALFITQEKIDFKKDWGYFAICALFGTSGNMFMFFKGLSMTKPINGAVLMMVTPLFVSIFEHWKKNKTPSLDTLIGLLIGSAGAAMLIAGKGAGFSQQTLTGDIWVAINAAFFAVYLVLVKRLVSKYNPVTVNRITFTIGVLYLAPIGLGPLLNTNFAIIPINIWLKIGYTLIFTSFLVYLLNAYGVKHGSSKLVGIYIYLQPVLATVIALSLGRDVLTFEKLFLTLMIVFGVWLVMKNTKTIFAFKSYRRK